jgi:hypothetical protein
MPDQKAAVRKSNRLGARVADEDVCRGELHRGTTVYASQGDRPLTRRSLSASSALLGILSPG